MFHFNKSNRNILSVSFLLVGRKDRIPRDNNTNKWQSEKPTHQVYEIGKLLKEK